LNARDVDTVLRMYTLQTKADNDEADRRLKAAQAASLEETRALTRQEKESRLAANKEATEDYNRGAEIWNMPKTTSAAEKYARNAEQADYLVQTGARIRQSEATGQEYRPPT